MKIEYSAPERIPGLKRLWQLAFGDSPKIIDAFFATAYAPHRCRCIPVGEEAAAALYWLDCEFEGQKLAYMYAVATHPEYRGRGLCRTLMEDTHRILTEEGYAGAILRPADAGLRQMYGKMGYADFGGVAEFSCAAGEKIPVRKIEIAEYARLRRAFLPEGGVLQEGENLSYLASYAEFYTGADFLLAAAEEGETLLGIELLGNPQAAPGILAALGYAQGQFRAPGGDIPFAMLRRLGTDVKNISYFGLVFD